MRNILIKIIRLYQRTPLHCHSNCKYIPTCSEYTVQALQTHGCIKGLYYGIKRIIRCNPFSKGGIDNVKEKK